MRTIYIVKLDNVKYLNKLIRNNYSFIKIKYCESYCLLYVDSLNYEKLRKYFDIYNLSLVKIKGFGNIKLIIERYNIFIISLVIGIIFLYYLSNIIFDVKIMSNNDELVKIIYNELNEAGIRKYRLIKSFSQKEEIRKKIIDTYKDKIEWLEIDRIGSKYYVHVLERIINKNNYSSKYQNIVARKNAVIMKIEASNGDIVCKVNDYVNRGDVLISGVIKKNDVIKDLVQAKGKVYGETWYIVRVELPRTYEVMSNTKNSFKRLSINLFDKRLFLFKNKKYINEEYMDKSILKSNLLPISLNITKINELKKDNYFYTYQDALEKGLRLAKEKLIDNLKGDSQILFQKKLKLYEENSTIIIEVFFKVYEDITTYEDIVIEE